MKGRRGKGESGGRGGGERVLEDEKSGREKDRGRGGRVGTRKEGMATRMLLNRLGHMPLALNTCYISLTPHTQREREGGGGGHLLFMPWFLSWGTWVGGREGGGGGRKGREGGKEEGREERGEREEGREGRKEERGKEGEKREGGKMKERMLGIQQRQLP